MVKSIRRHYSADAASHIDLLRNSGFDIEFSSDPDSAAELCRRPVRRFGLIVLLESETIAGRSSADIVRRTSTASPNLPCVLLPAGASAEQCEVAVRTAMRWRSVAYVGAAAAH